MKPDYKLCSTLSMKDQISESQSMDETISELTPQGAESKKQLLVFFSRV